MAAKNPWIEHKRKYDKMAQRTYRKKKPKVDKTYERLKRVYKQAVTNLSQHKRRMK